MFAGLALPRVFRAASAIAYLGCGCGSGPSARSLPAAAATWLAFGPAIAAARFGAAVGVALLLNASRRPGGCCDPARRSDSLLGELSALLPAALTAGAAMQLDRPGRSARPPRARPGGWGRAARFCRYALRFGRRGGRRARCTFTPRWPPPRFFALPGSSTCARSRAGRGARGRTRRVCIYAARARAWDRGIASRRRARPPGHCRRVRRAAGAAAVAAALHRRERDARARFAPIVMLLGALTAAPPPVYRATETTMSDLFPGERLTFTGVLSRACGAAAARPLRDYVLPRRRRTGRVATHAPAELSSRHVATRRRHRIETRAGSAEPRCRERRGGRAAQRPVHLPLVDTGSATPAYRRVSRGSSSSTGIPLGSSTNAIARVPLGDL